MASTHSYLRTDEVLGDTEALPAVGERFVMTAEPLDPGASMRLITTSPVSELLPDGFRTANSAYRLEVLN